MRPYAKIGAIIRKSTPKDKTPRFTPEQIEKFKTISVVVLTLVGVAGFVFLSAVAPNAIGALGKIFTKRYGHRKLSKKERDLKLTQTFYYMKRKGLVRFKADRQDFKIFLTKLGKKHFKKIQFENLHMEKQNKWNGKWWQVAADIPTKKYKRGADLLREKLRNMQFYPLQRTLWFYPYDPREEIEFIATHFGIANFVTVMEISRLDKDDESLMKSYFRKEGIII